MGLARKRAFALLLEGVALPPCPFRNRVLERACPGPAGSLHGVCICYRLPELNTLTHSPMRGLCPAILAFGEKKCSWEMQQ